jgi:hypothetical protein
MLPEFRPLFGGQIEVLDWISSHTSRGQHRA